MTDDLQIRQTLTMIEKYRRLLAFSETIAAQRDLSSLFNDLDERLRSVVEFDAVVTVLYDPAHDLARVQTHDGTLSESGSAPSDPPTEVSSGGWIRETQRPLIISDVEQESRFPELSALARERGLRSYCFLPLVAVGRWLGALGFGSAKAAGYDEGDLEFLGQVADQIAVAIDNAHKFEDARAAEQEMRLLLEVSNSMVSHLDLQELFNAISECLRRVIPHDAANLALYDAESGQLRVLALHSPAPVGNEGRGAPGGLIPIEGTPAGRAFTERRTLLISRGDLERFPAPQVRRLVSIGIRAGIIAPLVSHGRALGTLGLGSLTDGTFSETDVEMVTRIAGQIAIAVDNALNFDRARKAEQEVKRRLDRERLMLEINNAVVSELSLRELSGVISSCLRDVLHSDVTGVSLYDPETNQLRAYMFDVIGGLPPVEEGTPIPFKGSAGGAAFLSGRPVFIRRTEVEKAPAGFERAMIEAGIRSGGCVPLLARGRKLGVLGVASFREDAFSEADQELLSHIANQIAIAVDNALAYREIETLKNKLAEEKLYLEEEINTAYSFEEIIGSSPALKRILKQVETVAPTDSTVLIQGETGTGKELIARAIHSLSGRRERTLVKLNCAAIPTGLLESELFGHEKGAFTGAITQRIGRFELAHKGTLFLDEVGEIPVELQPKLLRVLQEQEFERLGSSRTQRVDARLVAATNRDLAKMSAENSFRSDLFYRLNVFPITIPPLRERPEDIPILMRFFASKFATRMKKQIRTISAESVAALQRYHWPGNIRELENIIERAVILTSGAELELSLSELKPTTPPKTAPVSTLEDAERQHILRALEETDWVISGPKGAAARLGMKRTTLHSRMQKLGISRQR
jgi:formate hydrogenlyase transcriptional activator